MKIRSVKAFLIKSDLSGGEIKTKPRRPDVSAYRRVAAQKLARLQHPPDCA